WWLLKQPHPTVSVLVRRMAPATVLLAATLGFMGYYNYRVFGSPFTIPYKINRATYASAPHFIWQSAHAEPVYRHVAMRNFYTGWELEVFRHETGSITGFLKESGRKLLTAGAFYLSFILVPP